MCQKGPKEGINYLDTLPVELFRQICLYLEVEDIHDISLIYPNLFEHELF